MRGRNNRLYRDGCAHHVFLKALDGNVLFYRTEDYVFFLTLLYYTARHYGIGIEAVCIMFNHVHTRAHLCQADGQQKVQSLFK